MIRWLMVCSFALTAGCSTSDGTGASGSGDGFPEEALHHVDGKHGELTIEVRTAPTQPPTRGSTSIEYRVTGARGEPVEALEVEVLAWMPEMAHAQGGHPGVTEEGEGRYVIDAVDLYMPGRWELRSSFVGGATPSRPIEDDAVVSLQIP